jgi:hypothetical protein
MKILMLNRTAYLALMAAVLVLLMAVSPARADDFSFSITNTVGNVSGTVTGEILGLTDGTTGPAAEVLILSYPTALFPDVVAAGNDTMNTATWGPPFINSFTETGGVITAGIFIVGKDVVGLDFGIGINNGVGTGGESGLQDYNSAFGINNIIETAGGLGALNLTPLGSPLSAPEPSSLILLGSGLLCVVALSVRSKCLAPSSPC